MEAEIDATERRILGVLIEKQLSTPDAYPLSVRDVLTGANQKTCRDPVSAYHEWEIEGALKSLFEKKWATYVEGGRVRKWKHRVDERLSITQTRLAVVAELLLRGPQQPGELRRNANRMANIPTDDDLAEILKDLAARMPPIVRNLGRAPRERDVRYGQTLADDAAAAPVAEGADAPPSAPPPSTAATAATTESAPPPEPRTPVPTLHEGASLADLLRRVEALEREVAALKSRST